MLPTPRLLAILFLCTLGPAEAQSAASPDDNHVLIMWWNAENLFDTLDDPLTNDNEFTPEGSRHWTSKRLALKYLRLAHIIKLAGAEHSVSGYPDILALAEVENQHVFRTLLSFLPDHHYRIVYHNSHDPRGIDIALAYNSRALRHVSSQQVKVPLPGKATRDISLHEFTCRNSRFFLILNHWPSRSLDRQWSEPLRLQAATATRAVVDSLLALDPAGNIIVAGDFNDEPEDRSVRQRLRSVNNREQIPATCPACLYNCWAQTDAPGSYHYRNRWNRLDQIMVSRAILEGSRGLMIDENSFTCFRPDHMQEGRSRLPSPTWKGIRYHGGYSDHFPLLLRIAIE